jgi:hypothetical protein
MLFAFQDMEEQLVIIQYFGMCDLCSIIGTGATCKCFKFSEIISATFRFVFQIRIKSSDFLSYTVCMKIRSV